MGGPVNLGESPEAIPELRRYRRQLVLPGFGRSGQEALASAHVAVVGAGGLGSPALLYLAGAGVGAVTLIDDDVVELSNLHRQVIHTTGSLGELKAESADRAMRALNDRVEVQVRPARLTPETAEDLLEGADLVLDGSDNFATRHAVSAECARRGIPHVWAAILGFEAQLSVFWAGRGPVYEDLYPAAPAPGTVPNCAQAGVLGPVVGVAGSAMAVEAIKLITEIGTPLVGRIGYYSALEGTWEYIPLLPSSGPPSPEPVKNSAAERQESPEKTAAALPLEEVEAAELGNLPEETLLLDVREREEFEALHIPGARNIPLSLLRIDPEYFAQHLSAEKSDPPTIIYCASGVRSREAAGILQNTTGKGQKHLKGGIESWLDFMQG